MNIKHLIEKIKGLFKKVLIGLFFSYEAKDREIFIKHMPNWYKVYETYPIFIILRILSVVFFVLSSRDIFRDYFAMRFYLDENINTLNTYNTVLDILGLCIIIIFWCHIIIKLILWILYIKELVYTRPFSREPAVISRLLFILSFFVCIGFLVGGINVIDNGSLIMGNVPPFQHYFDNISYYLNEGVTRPLGTESLDEYALFEGENPVINYLREEQIKTLEKRNELIEIYNREQKGK